MLTSREHAYFCRIRDYILNLFGLKVPIIPLDHKSFIATEEGEEVLGCCHRVANGYIISIDAPYIKACYYGRQTAYSPFSDNQLIETICHEIAHTQVWAHNKDHKDLTNALYDTVIASLKKAA